MAEALRVGVAGVGFIGKVHVRAARMAGAHVVGVSGGSLANTQAAAAEMAVNRVFASSEELATSADVDVVHICTPNHLHEALAALALEHGKHVVCEKPLATSLESARTLTTLAASAGRVATVPFVYRFHPLAREARARVASGEVGPLHLVHGSYQQDWLLTPDDYNWRVDPELGGASRAFADIGSHWCDLVEFVSGHRIVRLNAKTITAVPERYAADAVAFGAAAERGALQHVEGEDAVVMIFETDNGAYGTLVVSQVSAGRKNRLWFEMDGANRSVVFDQEHAESLWVGRRAESFTVERDASALDPSAARYATLPAGHAQGYADAFAAFVADTYRAIAGEPPDGLPVFADGMRAAALTETVLQSSRENAWKEVVA
jgi:predicted dehydrogenase